MPQEQHQLNLLMVWQHLGAGSLFGDGSVLTETLLRAGVSWLCRHRRKQRQIAAELNGATIYAAPASGQQLAPHLRQITGAYLPSLATASLKTPAVVASIEICIKLVL